MKVGDLVRMETMWRMTSEPKWFYGVVIGIKNNNAHVHWFDDYRKTWEGFAFLKVVA